MSYSLLHYFAVHQEMPHCVTDVNMCWTLLMACFNCRSRQAAITTELIEIISGAAALEG